MSLIAVVCFYKVNLVLHVRGRFEGEGYDKMYIDGEQVGCNVRVDELMEEKLLCFLGKHVLR